MLRIDDTDDTRSKPEYEDAILEDLAWLGLAHRSLRPPVRPRWKSTASPPNKLKAAGRLYPCYETAAELDRRRKRQMAAGKPPIYDRAALALTAEQRAEFEAEGRKPHWRFKLQPRQGALERSDPRAGGDRHRHPLRSGADPRGRRAFSTPCRRWWTMSISPSAISCAARIMSPTPRRRSRSSRRWARPVPRLRPFRAVRGGGRRSSVQARRLAVAARLARGRHRAAGAGRLSRPDRHLRRIEPALRWTRWRADFAFEKIGRAPAHFDPARTDGAERQDLASPAL